MLYNYNKKLTKEQFDFIHKTADDAVNKGNFDFENVMKAYRILTDQPFGTRIMMRKVMYQFTQNPNPIEEQPLVDDIIKKVGEAMKLEKIPSKKKKVK